MKAPSFSLPDQNGKIHKLSDYKGNWLVIYFYPKDETPGCTKEACAYRDVNSELSKMGVKILGISKDSVASHKKFETNHSLTFPLLSDTEHATIEAYGAWKPKKFMGKEFLGTNRNTIIIDPSGQIVKEYQNVNPQEHIKIVIEDLKELMKIL